MPSIMLEHALGYAARGFSVVPVHSAQKHRCSCGNAKCSSPGKHPRMKWQGHANTKLTEDEINSFWSRYPESNIGIATGAISGLSIIDIDDQVGVDALREIGIDIDAIDAPVVQTGGGGLHIYCRYNGELGTRAGVLPKVDIRSDGGLIIAPPSVHTSGRRYEWVEGMSLDDFAPLELDLTWAARPTNGHRAKSDTLAAQPEYWFEQTLRGVGQGGRNDAATRLAGRYLGLGMTAAEVLLILESWNQTNDPPLPRRDIETVVDSISRREDARADQLSREEALRKIGDALKLNLLDMRRITGDDPQIILAFREGTCQISTEVLLSSPGLVAAIAKATKIVVRKLSHKTSPKHTELAQWVLDGCRDEDAGVEATAQGEIEALVMDYLDSQRLTTVEEGAPVRGCFSIKGKKAVWMSLDDLVTWGRSKGVRISPKQTAQLLKTLNWVKREFATDVGGRRVVWSANDD